MAQYKYQAIAKDGKKISGTIEAYGESDAVSRLKPNVNVILKLSEQKEGGLLSMGLGGSKLNAKAFTVMCNQFAIILKAGMPIARTVHLIADKTSNKPLKEMLEKVAEDVDAGRAISQSFDERGKKLLPATFIETIRAGEASGSLDRSFAVMAEHFEKQSKIKGKVKGALAYPVFVLILAVAVIVVMMVVVVPKLMEAFTEFGGELPLPTRILIAISNFFSQRYLIILAIAALIFIAHRAYKSTEEGRINLAKLQLKLPVLGNIAELNAASQFANTMTTLLNAGLPLTKTVAITAKTLDNYYLSTECAALTPRVEEGHSLGSLMREANFMPGILTDMVAVGEETGELEETLRTIAQYYDAELDMAVDGALKKLEPALLVGLALVAGFIVIAIYMAMFGMYDVM